MKNRVFSSLLFLVLLCLCSASVAQQKNTEIALEEQPYSLTTNDGVGLRLVDLDAKVVVDGPLAFTELKVIFQNPQDRQIEGRFNVTMPDGAALSRFAMKIAGGWMEGEVVEKQAARRAYEDALHRRIDPALMEQDSGNRFHARVFPIAANERKEIIISWSQELKNAGESYRLPLIGLPEIEHLSITTMVSNDQKAQANTSLGGEVSQFTVNQIQKDNFKPSEDFVVFDQTAKESLALRNGELSVARFVLPEQSTEDVLENAVLAIDTSASRGIGYEERLQRLEQLITALAQKGLKHVDVVAFDQTAEVIFQGEASQFAEAVSKLAARGALGATNFEAAINVISTLKAPRLLFVTDGMFDAGEIDSAKIKQFLTSLKDKGFERADVLVDTSARDMEMLESLVLPLPRAGQVVDVRKDLTEVTKRLLSKTYDSIEISVENSVFVWPSNLRGLQGGDTALVYAESPANQKLSIKLSGDLNLEVTPTIREAQRPLLERATVHARIERLQALMATADRDLKNAYKEQIIALSTKHRVLSSFTALLVLERESDYQRFNIDRNALADIMVVSATGIALEHRTSIVTAPIPVPRKAAQPVDRIYNRTARPSNSNSVDGFAEGARGGSAALPRAPRAEAAVESVTADEDADDVAPEENIAEEAEETEEADDVAGDGAMPMEAAPMLNREIVAVEMMREPPEPSTNIIPMPAPPSIGREPEPFKPNNIPALTGKMAEIDAAIKNKKAMYAFTLAVDWYQNEKADPLVFVALGRAYLALGQLNEAARAFGSLIDLYPSRADIRRMAANWLETVNLKNAQALAIDCYRKALEQRPDHPAIYHMLAFALAQNGQYQEAFELPIQGLAAKYPRNRFQEIERILKEDAGIIAQAWLAADSGAESMILKRLRETNLSLDKTNTMRFILTWETDANDVDFHIIDNQNEHAFFGNRTLKSGGNLYADITTGYGPECFKLDSPKAFPYELKAHYYSRGPMGFGGGRVQIIRHDGKGKIGVETRPFIIMNERAYVDMGKVTEKTAL